MSKETNNRQNGEKSPAAKAVMIATGVSLGLALSFFVLIGRGIKNCFKAIESLKDHNGQ